MAKVEETFCYGYTTRWGPDGRPPVRRCWKKMRGQRIEPRPEGERNTERDISDVATCSLNFRPVKYKGCLYKDRPAVYISLSLSLSPSIFIVPLKLASNSWRLIKHSRISTELNGDVFSSPSPPIYNTQHNRVMKHDEEFLFFFLLDFIHLSTYILISQR